jgi:hypothetical protein
MTTLALPESVTLPPGLTDVHRHELAALWREFAPRDAFERLLVTRLIQATARLHLSAAREPEGTADPLWLRYESAADRLFRQSLAALRKHRAENPIETDPELHPAPPEPRRADPRTARLAALETRRPTRTTLAAAAGLLASPLASWARPHAPRSPAAWSPPAVPSTSAPSPPPAPSSG